MYRTLARPCTRICRVYPADFKRALPLPAWAVLLQDEFKLHEFREGMHQPYAPEYGSLKLDQVWDPLRGNPRFEEIVASLAPST